MASGCPLPRGVGVEAQCLLPVLISHRFGMPHSADEVWQTKQGQLSISHFVSFVLLTCHSGIAKREMLETQQRHGITAVHFAKSKDTLFFMAQNKAVRSASITVLTVMINSVV